MRDPLLCGVLAGADIGINSNDKFMNNLDFELLMISQVNKNVLFWVLFSQQPIFSATSL